MAEIIGTAAAILQLVGLLSQELLTLRNTYIAIRDIKNKVGEIYEIVHSLEIPILFIQQYIQSRPDFELREITQDVTASCYKSLRIIQEKLPAPSGSAQRINIAIKMWMQDRDIEQARKHISSSLQSLMLIMQVLHMYVDMVDVASATNLRKDQN